MGYQIYQASALALNPSCHIIIGSRIMSSGSQAASKSTSKGLSASSIQLDITSKTSISTVVGTLRKYKGASTS